MNNTKLLTLLILAVFLSTATITSTAKANDLNNFEEEIHFDQEMNMDDFDHDEFDDNFDDIVFGQNPDWDAIDTIYDNSDEKIDSLLEKLEDATVKNQDTTSIKQELVATIESVYNQLTTFVTSEGLSILTEEKNEFIDFVNNFEKFEDEDMFEESEEDMFEDLVFGELTKEQYQKLDKEFDRHYNVIDPLYDEYFDSNDKSKHKEIKNQMVSEINIHYNNLLTFTQSEEGKNLLTEEKNEYIKSLDELDEEMEEFEDEDDNFDDIVFGQNPDWDAIHAIYNANEEQIENFFKQIETLREKGEDTTSIKNQLISLIENIYTQLLPYATQEGKALLAEEKNEFIDYIKNFEKYEAEFQTEDHEDKGNSEYEDGTYPEIKELSDAEWKNLDTLWDTHEKTMETLLQEYETTKDNSQKETLKNKMITEINDVYNKMQPFVTSETQQYIEVEKNEYLEFLNDELSEIDA